MNERGVDVKMRKIIAILISLSIFLSAGATNIPTFAESNDSNQAALLLRAKSYSYIDEIDTTKQLKSIKSTYEDTYNKLINSTEGNIKSQLEKQKNNIIKYFDDKIKELEILNRRKLRNRGLQGFFRKSGRAVRQVGKGVFQLGKWSVSTLGKGIEESARTIISTFPTTPEGIVAFIVEHGSGSFSIKRILKTIAVKSFKDSVQQSVFAQMVKVINDPNKIDDYFKAYVALGGSLDKEKYVERYKKYLEKYNQEKGSDSKDNNSSDKADPEVGYEGEGGYDEPDPEVGYEGEGGYDDPNEATPENLFAQFLENCSNNEIFYVEMEGAYTLTDFQVRVPPKDYYTAYLEEWDYFGYDLNHFINKSEEFKDDRVIFTTPFIGATNKTENALIIAGNPNVMENMFASDSDEINDKGPIYFYLVGLTYDDWIEADDIFGITGVIATDQIALELGKKLEEEVIISPDADWKPSGVTNIYETVINIDENGFLNVKGSFTKNNDFSIQTIEYEGYAPETVEHMIDMTISFDMTSKEALSLDPIILE